MSNVKNVNSNKNVTAKNVTVKDNNKNINNDNEVKKMNDNKKATAKKDVRRYGEAPVLYEDMEDLLDIIIGNYTMMSEVDKVIASIKEDYKPYKKDYIEYQKKLQYKKPVKEVNFIIPYPDVMLTQEGEIKITTRTRALLFNDWYNNHFKIDDIDSNDKPILKNIELESFQSKIFLRLAEEVKNKDSEDMLISKSDLRREGQRLFKCIIDEGEGRWGNIQVKYCLATIAQQAKDSKVAREVHRDLFSKILFTAFAEGELVSRPQKISNN